MQSTTKNYWKESKLYYYRGSQCEAPLFITTKSVYIALDVCDRFKLVPEFEEPHQLYGINISSFCNIVPCKPLHQMSSISVIYNPKCKCTSNGNYSIPCTKYKISVIKEHNQDVITTVTQRSCDPWTVRHLFRAAPSQIPSVINIRLKGVPMPKLLIEDLLFFPNLRELILDYVPLTSKSLEENLLCYSGSLKYFRQTSSRGHLQKFPSHIFNCSKELSVKTIIFEEHNIVYLLAYAFRSAANSVKYLLLCSLGLIMIHKDAFAGVRTLEILKLEYNKITTPSYFIIPPTSDWHVLIINSYQSNSESLDVDEIMEQKHLTVLLWNNNNISSLTGTFCSGEHNSKLKYLSLESNVLLELSPPLFDKCVSLKYLLLSHNNVSHLDAALLACNVSLVGLDLSYNMLTDNVSWPVFLGQQHELRYLNISFNMLSSWTQNLSAVWQLKQLDISWNHISTIAPSAFANLTQLELASFEGNKLYEIEITCVLPFIREINIAENSLNLVICVSNISNAHLIDVSLNNISVLIIGTRKQCPPPCHDITLHAENNKLSSFILTCSDIQQYTLVDLSNNTLKDFLSMFPDLENKKCVVKIMNVSWNTFRVIDKENWIPPLDSATYEETIKYRVSLLDMTYCNIVTIALKFCYIVGVSKLDLRHNNIHSIDENLMRLSIVNTDLHNNPLQCDCHTFPLKRNLVYQAETGGNQMLVSHCTHSLWHELVVIQSLPDDMFLCPLMCP